MDLEQRLAEHREETEDIIENLLEDGSNPEVDYCIEHHLASDDFAKLEKAAIEAFKLGYDVTDAEEVELEDGGKIFCCDVTVEIELDADRIMQDAEVLLRLAEKLDVEYDGWGTYFEE